MSEGRFSIYMKADFEEVSLVQRRKSMTESIYFVHIGSEIL